MSLKTTIAALPRPARLALWVIVPASLVPFTIVANHRATSSSKPRVQIIQGMGNQPRLAAQDVSTAFDDGRAMRQPVTGTVARGRLTAPDHYHLGYHPGVTFVDPETGEESRSYHVGFPPQVAVDAELLDRGRERYDIFCAPCHAASGSGEGTVHARAVELETPTWVQPANLHSEDIIAQPAGRVFDTITSGAGTMPPYAAQIGVHDRWAIVAYVQALQLSQRAPIEAVPPDKRTR